MKISVIIVTFNHENYIKKCLKTLFNELVGLNSEIIVLDNNSNDHTRKIIKKINNKKVQLIVNNKNLGFAKACNKGIRKAKGEFIYILNPDTQVLEQSIKKLISFLKQNKNAACVVPKLLNPNESIQFSVRKFPNLLTVISKRTPLKIMPLIKKTANSHLIKNLHSKKLRWIDWALGGCLMVRKQVFAKIGFFDERFFMYCEDIDWFYRLKKAGLKAYYLPSAKVIHHHLAVSDKKLWSKESYYHLKSIWYFFKKYWREILTLKYP